MKKNSSAKKALQRKKAFSMQKALPWIIVGIVVVVIGVLLFKPSASSSGSGFRNVDSAGLARCSESGRTIRRRAYTGRVLDGAHQGLGQRAGRSAAETASSWDRNADYVLYCASGERSAAGQSAMQSMGFKNVANLTGGVASWSGPLEKGATTSQQTIPTSGKPVFVELYTPT